jgi:hypothetical protein
LKGIYSIELQRGKLRGGRSRKEGRKEGQGKIKEKASNKST